MSHLVSMSNLLLPLHRDTTAVVSLWDQLISLSDTEPFFPLYFYRVTS